MVGIYRDSLILVVHAAPDPSPIGLYNTDPTTMDIYDLEGAKLWHEVQVPGPVYRVGNYVYILETAPPDTRHITPVAPAAAPENPPPRIGVVEVLHSSSWFIMTSHKRRRRPFT